MARPFKGHHLLKKAQKRIKEAKTVEELRMAQTLVLPLQYDLSLDDVSQVTGISRVYVSRLRNLFIQSEGKALVQSRRGGGRRRAHMTAEEEVKFLKPFLEEAKNGSLLVAGSIHRAWQEKLGRKVALSSVYNLLARHNWRKLAPDKYHPKSDPEAQEVFKKNSPKHCAK